MTAAPDSTPLVFRQREIGGWSFPTVSLDSMSRDPVALQVLGIIANAVNGKEKQQPWKKRLASEVKAARGDVAWNPDDAYAISLALRFCPSKHGGSGQRLDVENFVKPIVDAIAAGLFCRRANGPGHD